MGARCDDDNGNASGSVYIYEWSGSAWAETKIIASDGAGGDAFGWSVSIEGDRAIVGAYADDDNGSASGSVYIYERNGNAWIETKITASDGSDNDRFGWSVSVKGDRAIVGAYADDDNGNASGSVYIYDWNGSTWVETKVTASDGTSNDAFGESVSIADNRSIVGARYDDDKGSNSGSAYIYECAIPTGTSCDDSKPCTINTVIMSDCSCLGTISTSSNTWIGTTGLWHDISNWSAGTVPELCDDVLIPSGAHITIQSGMSAECYTLYVDHGAELVTEGTAELHVIVE